MPFDPALPQEHAELDAAIVRGQLNALHDEIAAIPAGPPGPPGPAFGAVVVDAVSTLNPGEPATVGTSFDGSAVHFTYGIPRGDTGPQGDAGEVTQSALDGAIAGTAQNPAAVAPLALPISDPPTQAEVQAILDAHNALLAALLR